jgi:hypothetical protein
MQLLALDHDLEQIACRLTPFPLRSMVATSARRRPI